MEQQEHGQKNHVNVLVLDQDSEITSFGKHNRLIVAREVDGGQYVIREDILHGLPMSTEEDRQRVAKGYQRLHPKGTTLKHVSSSSEYAGSSWKSIEHRYEAFRDGKPVRSDVISLKAGSRQYVLRPVDMKIMPSDNPSTWLKFQGRHVADSLMEEPEQDRLQAFMKRWKSEALTDGVHNYTLAGGMLAHCQPEAFQ